jgi:hypothetical protein
MSVLGGPRFPRHGCLVQVWYPVSYLASLLYLACAYLGEDARAKSGQPVTFVKLACRQCQRMAAIELCEPPRSKNVN